MKNRKAILTVLTSLALLAAASVRSRAQSAAAPPDSAVPGAEQAPPPPPPGQVFFRFRSVDESFDGKVVTGVPYSADAVTERTQVLADGNRIVQKTTAHLARDSQGRTRREQTLGEIGPWGAPADLPPMTMINDPVAGVHFVLDARRKIAFKHPLGDKGISFTASPDGGSGAVVYRHHEILNPPGPEASDRTSTQVSLGTRTIEGVQAQGTRTTVTIAAGAIGNDQPIQIVSERWYSPELQAVVMTKHSDPRFGDSVYRLTNISRDEPAPSLFEVPPDYTVKEGPGNVVFRRKLGDK
ncbi:MAG TPA: hypothetical protein VGW33_14880 [Terriglobia bacterium]|nr:hypothetical protein [Terriglobia bacterium]